MFSIEPGQQFREAAPTMFGRAGAAWIVTRISAGTDGLLHARIVMAADPSQAKTIAVDVLADRRRFVAVE
jgi:hypothetical protein